VAEGNAPRVATMLTSQTNVFAAREKAHAGQVSILEQQIAQSEEEIVGLQGEISAEKVQLRLLAEEIEAKESLLKKGLIDKPQVLALKHRQAEIIGDMSRNSAAIARVRKGIGEAKIRISELETLQVNEAVAELQDVESEIFELEEQLGAAEDTLRRTVIRAPIEGTIVGLNVHTRGGVIGPGEALMDIVPSEERLLINARIDPVGVDVVRPGLPAHIRLTAYNQRHLDPLKGRLLSVSADHLVEERTGDPYYLGRVELLANQDQPFEETELYPGMQTEVMILTGSNTLLDYIAEPITRTLRRAFRED
jgi:HlyD family type I secretion membrane fusion protein